MLNSKAQTNRVGDTHSLINKDPSYLLSDMKFILNNRPHVATCSTIELGRMFFFL